MQRPDDLANRSSRSTRAPGTRRKLALDRLTLRTLSADQLDHVAGGLGGIKTGPLPPGSVGC
jgi:hypothetical protein